MNAGAVTKNTAIDSTYVKAQRAAFGPKGGACGTGDRPLAGTVRNSVCGRAVEHYAAMALMKRSPKMTANWALAMDHSRGGIFHSFSDRFKIR